MLFSYKKQNNMKITKTNDDINEIRKRENQIRNSLIGKRFVTKKTIGSKGDNYTVFKVYSHQFKCIDTLCSCKGFLYRKTCRHVK